MSETGIGWDAEHRCFVAHKEQWAYLSKMNKGYVEFQTPNNADLVMVWDEVIDGKHATGSQVQSSAQPSAQFVPLRVRRRRADYSGKGKGVASRSVIDLPHHFLSFDDDGSPVGTHPSKRPLSTGAYSSKKEGSSSSKSRKSSSENYQEALSNFNRFSCIVSSERESKEKYSIEAVKKVVESLKLEDQLHMFLLKELLDKEFRALFLSFSQSEQLTWIDMFIKPKMV
ncbi:uncharacterized protein [Coffea arabica]|uniref:Myb/SANT-like domain-containing protein n=1 Tax=Coffea arabica TaxID=13443 RepID=A0ABM4WIL4_COFAR